MKLLEPEVIIEEFDNMGAKLEKKIERCGRTCYRSESTITEDSYKTRVPNWVKLGHTSVMDHASVTIHLLCDVGVYKDLTRHRHAAFSIESTRYCNYSKDKFSNEINFIRPCNIKEGTIEYTLWTNCMKNIEDVYMEMSKLNCLPDQMRMILPHSTAAHVCMTCDITEWRHVLNLRCSKKAHPAVQQVMIPVLLYFKQVMPELFEDIPYNEDFDKEKYAKLSTLKV